MEVILHYYVLLRIEEEPLPILISEVFVEIMRLDVQTQSNDTNVLNINDHSLLTNKHASSFFPR